MIENAEMVRDLVDYSPESGELTWKVRDIKYCQSQAHCDAWNRQYAGKPAIATKMNTGYLSGTILSVPCLAHRVAWLIYYGEAPQGPIDHINGDRADNRIANLRCVNLSMNQRNKTKQKNNKSGFTGVYWKKPGKRDVRGRWRAAFKLKNKEVHVGYFDDPKEADEALRDAMREHGFTERHGL